jgi:hypothetical protein
VISYISSSFPLHSLPAPFPFPLSPNIITHITPAAQTAAPPNSAPISTTPVGTAHTAPPAPACEELVLNGLLGVSVNVVLWETPLVNGTFVAELAPENAALVAVGFGLAAVLLGLRALSMTCTTPFATRTSGTMTRAEFT